MFWFCVGLFFFDVALGMWGLPQYRELFFTCAVMAAVGAGLNWLHLKDKG